MTAHPLYAPSNYQPNRTAIEPVSTPEQAAQRIATWDAGDGKSDPWWCVSCLTHRAMRIDTYARVSAWLSYLCPVCIEGAS